MMWSSVAYLRGTLGLGIGNLFQIWTKTRDFCRVNKSQFIRAKIIYIWEYLLKLSEAQRTWGIESVLQITWIIFFPILLVLLPPRIALSVRSFVRDKISAAWCVRRIWCVRRGLSARRARRTKSRGPKGLQLEVRARRAPRLQYRILIWMES